jgi:hypothetical protein
MTDDPKDPKPTPANFGKEIDCLFAALQQVADLLALGRAYGLCVGLSPALAAEIAKRHGDAATTVLSNTWRVNPTRSIDHMP